MPARWGGSARQWATNIRLQPLGEKIKYPLTGRAVAQILMHYQPGIKIQRKVGRQHSLQGNNAIRKRHLADADPRSGADQAQLGEVAIGPHREGLTLKTRVSLQGPAHEGGGAIKTNQRVAGQIVEGRGQALARQVGGGGM